MSEAALAGTVRATAGDARLAPPLAMLLELTHRCPLQCPYCANPVALDHASAELSSAEWLDVLDQAAALGVLQVHFSGGEPTVRRDLEELVRRAAALGLYSNLITAGVLLQEPRVAALVQAGLDHVQLSIQDSDAGNADRIAGYRGGFERKLAVARWVRDAGLPLTVNAPVHRQNLERLPEMIELSVAMGAERLEVAHVQYYGWALRNRTSLMPTLAQLERATEVVEAARQRLKGTLVIDYVVPDYYAHRPKACMGGWGRQFINVTPRGKALPCHAAETLPGLAFDNVRTRRLKDIWENSPAFNAFRGVDWMPPLCRDCERREIDWGGCRCQAFAMTGDAAVTDPACALSSHHGALVATAQAESSAAAPPFIYRCIGG